MLVFGFLSFPYRFPLAFHQDETRPVSVENARINRATGSGLLADDDDESCK